MYILIGLLLWTILSIWWFANFLGSKFRDSHWYDVILGFPVLSLIYGYVTASNWFQIIKYTFTKQK